MQRPFFFVLLDLCVRAVFYAGLLAGFSLIILQGSGWARPHEFYTEQGVIEWLEVLLLSVMTLIFWIAGQVDSTQRVLSLVLVAFGLSAGIRELDFYMDEHLFDGAWQTGVTLVLTAVAIGVWCNLKSFSTALYNWIGRSSFGVMLSGVLVVLVFSRLFGYKAFWYGLFDDRSVARLAKTVAEEGTEQVGYYLMTVAACEYLHEAWLARRRRLSGSTPDK